MYKISGLIFLLKDKYHIQKEIFGKVKDPSYMIYSFWLQNLNITERIVS